MNFLVWNTERTREVKTKLIQFVANVLTVE